MSKLPALAAASRPYNGCGGSPDFSEFFRIFTLLTQILIYEKAANSNKDYQSIPTLLTSIYRLLFCLSTNIDIHLTESSLNATPLWSTCHHPLIHRYILFTSFTLTFFFLLQDVKKCYLLIQYCWYLHLSVNLHWSLNCHS